MAKQGEGKGKGLKTSPRPKLSEAKALARGVAWGIRRGKPKSSPIKPFSERRYNYGILITL